MIDRRSLLLSAAIMVLPIANSPGSAADAYDKDNSRGFSKEHGQYALLPDKPAQVIWGLGYEIQCDSIGSGNMGLPEQVISVPNNLLPEERTRFYHQMLRGFRYCRLAMGLYLRGLDTQHRQIIERYHGQMADLAEMQKESGIEGFDVEYWSPAPYWKSNNRYIGGSLRSFDADFLHALAAAFVQDLHYLESHGLRPVQWGLQNEPPVSTTYSSCVYTPWAYRKAFKQIAPVIHAAYPKLLIHATSQDGQGGRYGSLLQADPEAEKYVDAWTWHRVGTNSDDQIRNARSIYCVNTHGKPVFNNEFEYLYAKKITSHMFVNTAQSIMNWFVFVNSPTWYWLHALKPIANSEAVGYALGFWRPPGDDNFKKYPDLLPGQWTYNPPNFNAIAGFLRYMPWNSTRINVHEHSVRADNRILAFKTPAGKLVFVLTNRTVHPYTFHIDTRANSTFSGYRYTIAHRDVRLSELRGAVISPTLPAYSIEFWIKGT